MSPPAIICNQQILIKDKKVVFIFVLFEELRGSDVHYLVLRHTSNSFLTSLSVFMDFLILYSSGLPILVKDLDDGTTHTKAFEIFSYLNKIG